MATAPELLLRRLAEGDEHFMGTVMSPAFASGIDPAPEQALDRRTRTLVQLGALLAVGAPTACVQWAVELASATGAGVDTMTGVLLASAPATGTAGVVEGAPRLAVALGFDLELDGWDGS